MHVSEKCRSTVKSVLGGIILVQDHAMLETRILRHWSEYRCVRNRPMHVDPSWNGSRYTCDICVLSIFLSIALGSDCIYTFVQVMEFLKSLVNGHMEEVKSTVGILQGREVWYNKYHLGTNSHYFSEFFCIIRIGYQSKSGPIIFVQRFLFFYFWKAWRNCLQLSGQVHPQ